MPNLSGGDEAEMWLSGLPQTKRKNALYVIDSILKFSEEQYSDFFQTCGLYAVGSTVNGRSRQRDTDIVLVGMTFVLLPNMTKFSSWIPKLW